MSDHLLGYVLRSFRTEEETSKLRVLIGQRLKKRTDGQSNAISMHSFQSAARKQQAEFLKLRYKLNIRYGKSGWHNRHQARGLSFKIFCKYSSFQKIEPLLKTKTLKRDTNALTGVGALMTLIDFTLSNARRCY